ITELSGSGGLVAQLGEHRQVLDLGRHRWAPPANRWVGCRGGVAACQGRRMPPASRRAINMHWAGPPARVTQIMDAIGGPRPLSDGWGCRGWGGYLSGKLAACRSLVARMQVSRGPPPWVGGCIPHPRSFPVVTQDLIPTLLWLAPSAPSSSASPSWA